jgi:hypothetical protein
MDLELLINSDPASGFQEIITEILCPLNFEDLLRVRQVSTSFEQFLRNNRKVWNQVSSRTFSNVLDKADTVRFPNRLMENVMTKVKHFENNEVMVNFFKKNWSDIFDKIKTLASIPRLMNICKYLQTQDDYSKIRVEISSLMRLGGYPEIPAMSHMWTYLMCVYLQPNWAGDTPRD